MVAVLVAAASGCSSSRKAAAPEAEVPASAVEPRVGLAATFEVPENPYADSSEAMAAAVPFTSASDEGLSQSAWTTASDTNEIDPNAIVVSRYDYGQSEAGQTETYTDYEEALEEYEDYYGAYPGYASETYRYADPALYPSVYSYYNPYRTHRTYRRHGWCRAGYYASVHYNPYRIGYYDPYVGMYCYTYRRGLYVSVGVGWGGYDPYYYDPYYSPYYHNPFYVPYVTYGYSRGYRGYSRGYRDGY